MIPKTSLKMVAASGALVLGGAVAAAAVTTPDEAEDGLDKASEETGFELPASQENHPTRDDHPGGGAEEGTEVEEEELELEGERPENHGFHVSEFATTTELTGSERGHAIADVAQSNAGKPEGAGGDAGTAEREAPPVETPNDGGTDTAAQASGGASDAGASEAPDQAAQGSSNASSNRP